MGQRPGAIIRAQQETGGSLFRLRQTAPDLWRLLIGDVARTICVMPLWKLQTVGSERLNFLYDNLDRGSVITLKPGVAYCLRSFYGLIRDLIQGAWVRFVQRLNCERPGSLPDLGSFLFGTERDSLDAYRPILREVQQGRCFYCHESLRHETAVDHFIPDHFIPWSRSFVGLATRLISVTTSCCHIRSATAINPTIWLRKSIWPLGWILNP